VYNRSIVEQKAIVNSFVSVNFRKVFNLTNIHFKPLLNFVQEDEAGISSSGRYGTPEKPGRTAGRYGSPGKSNGSGGAASPSGCYDTPEKEGIYDTLERSGRCTELSRAMEGIKYIAEVTKREEESNKVIFTPYTVS
jgi:hypothetical protein